MRRRRVEAGIRQDHLADRVGISASHLSRFERGQRQVSLETLDAIIVALIELGRGALDGPVAGPLAADVDPSGASPSSDGSSRSPPAAESLAAESLAAELLAAESLAAEPIAVSLHNPGAEWGGGAPRGC